MSKRLWMKDGRVTLRAISEDQVIGPARRGGLISQEDQPRLHSWLQAVADWRRAAGGPGVLMQRAEAMAAWEAVNPPERVLDCALLALDEIALIRSADAQHGVPTQQAVDRACAAALEPFSRSRRSAWPLTRLTLVRCAAITWRSFREGGRIDVWPGRRGPRGRKRLPAAAAASFDAVYEADLASVP